MIAALWCIFQFFTGPTQAGLESAQSALEWMRTGKGYLGHLALAYLALSDQGAGHEDIALVELNNTLRAQSANLSNCAHLLFAQALMYMSAGKLQHVEQTAQHFLRLSQEADLAMSQSWAHSLLGYAHYEWNNLDMAAYHFSAVVANLPHTHHWAAQEAMYGLALVYRAQGLHTQAKETTDALLEFVQRRNSISSLMPIYAFQGQLALLRDDVESAERWVEMAGEQWALSPLVSFAIPPITKAHLLLTRGDEPGVEQGQEILAMLLQPGSSMRSTRKMIQALALQAIAYDLQGRVTEALDTLERAIELARPGGFIRAFADLPPLVKLLQELRKRRKACQATDNRLDTYLQRLLVAMNPTALQAVSTQELMRQKGLEPLTNRELQILRLLSKDLTNKEIARELVVTSGTIKAHTNSIYRKLSVKNRRSAVTLCKSLDLLAAN
jgi:LuxR family maltose regulon positive regulatory protein